MNAIEIDAYESWAEAFGVDLASADHATDGLGADPGFRCRVWDAPPATLAGVQEAPPIRATSRAFCSLVSGGACVVTCVMYAAIFSVARSR